MTTLLQLHTSIHAEEGASSQLAQQFVASWSAHHADSQVIRRDLANQPVPHLTAERFAAFLAPAAQRSRAQQEVVTYSDALIEEIRRADVIVLGLPMYNFGVPSQLKAYFDHIARAGVTFRYTDKGPVGLLGGKRVFVFATRGGLHAGTALDTQSSYVRDFLRFLGIEQVEFIYAEGLAYGAEARETGLASARSAIERLVA